MSKHTHGRWWANEKRHDDYPTKISIETDSYNICLVDGGLDQQANASLIAAAPDLLEALEIVQNATIDIDSSGSWGSIRVTVEDWNIIKSAIALAKGESS